MLLLLLHSVFLYIQHTTLKIQVRALSLTLKGDIIHSNLSLVKNSINIR